MSRVHLALGIVCALLMVAGDARGQDQSGGRKVAEAAQVPGGTIRIDGRLDEEAWLTATPITDFVQKEPTEGRSGRLEPATARKGGPRSCGFRSHRLRFNPQSDQIWGVNIRRFRPTLEEEDYWVIVPRTERFISRFGDLRGIRGVRPAPITTSAGSGRSSDGSDQGSA